MSTKIRKLTKNGTSFYPQTHIKAIVGDNGAGVDNKPTKNSNNLVSSGGVFDEIANNGAAFDVTVYNSGQTYTSLSEALNAVPTDYKNGGMSIKYVQSSDNKYVQARCMAQNFTTDVTQWQSVDDEPTAGSNNLVKSGGVANKFTELETKIGTYTIISGNGLEMTSIALKKDKSYRIINNGEFVISAQNRKVEDTSQIIEQISVYPDSFSVFTTTQNGVLYVYCKEDFDVTISLDKSLSNNIKDLEDKTSTLNTDAFQNNYSRGAFGVGKNIKPMLTFIDDDGMSRFYDFWIPIILSKSIPVTVPVIVGKVGTEGFCTWDNLRELRDKYGVEIIAHSYNHKILASDYDNLTVDDIAINDYGKAKRILAEHGFNTDFMCYPGASADNVKARRATTRDYSMAIASSGFITNTVPINQYFMKRYAIGRNDGVAITFEELKTAIDDAYNNNGWSMLMSHCQYTSMTEASKNAILQAIDYARQKDVDIVTLKEGFVKIGNIVNIEGDTVDHNGYRVGANGVVQGNGIGCGLSVDQLHNFYSKTSEFPIDNICEEKVNIDTGLFPRGSSGILRTIRTSAYMVQTFIPYVQNEIWERRVLEDKLPQEFTPMTTLFGAFSDRNNYGYEKVGNCYFDTTNLRPIWVRSAGMRTTDIIIVTHSPNKSGNVSFTTKLGTVYVALEAGDTMETVATKIANTSFPGFVITKSTENLKQLYLTRAIPQECVHTSFNDSESTGVGIVMGPQKDGVEPIWVDASGKVLS